MGLLVLGLAMFFAVHLLTSFRDTRAVLIERFGAGVYKGGYSLLSAAGLAMIALGMAAADAVPVWTPPAAGRRLALATMPLAVILMAGAFVPSNLRRMTAHPMLWGVALWAVLHLLANGDLASMLLFGSFAAYAFYAMWAQTQRGAEPSQRVHPIWRDVALVIFGLALSWALMRSHHLFAGVALS